MIILLIFTILFGLSVGSFLNVVIHRMPIGESIVHPRSYCPECKHKLSYLDLIPVFSWLVRFGKCGYCKTPIPIRYLYIELITCILFVCSLYSKPSDLLGYNSILILIFGWILISIAIPLTFLDIKELWLPSVITNSGITFGILVYTLQFIQNNNTKNFSILVNHLQATLIIFIFLRGLSYIGKKIIKKNILGLGDANLMAMAGAWLGTNGLEIVIILSILFAGTYSAIGLIIGFLKRGAYIPLGAFISPSIVATWILGSEFWIKNLGNLLWWRYI